MTSQIEMPQLSSEGESATLASWLVEPGDRVEKGDVIAELETDKATVELEAPASGTIAELLVSAGTEDIGPGTLLGTLDPTDEADASTDATDATDASTEAAADEATGADSEPPTAEVGAEAEGAVTADEEQAAAEEEEGARARPASVAAETPAEADHSRRRGPTPLARRVASEQGIDVSELAGSGPGGRIVEADVREAAGASRRAPSDEAVAGVTPEATRRPARSLGEASPSLPQLRLRMRCSMQALLAAQARLDIVLQETHGETTQTRNAFLLKAMALALRDVPAANVSLDADSMELHQHDPRVDLAVAVGTETGLETLAVRAADRKGIATLSEEVGALGALAREGKLRSEQSQGGTFVVCDLGDFGIEAIDPVLSPPRTGILGVGAVQEQPVVVDGKIVIGRVARFTLAVDARVIDAAVAAQLMAALRSRLEDPAGMIL